MSKAGARVLAIRACGPAAIAGLLLAIAGCGGGGGGSPGGGTPSVVVSTLAAGGASTCRTGTTSTRCWGLNDEGQLGFASPTSTATPTDLPLPAGRSAASVAIGVGHACAVLDNATVACWGSNSNGQLGQDPTSVTASPTATVIAGVTAQAVVVGFDHSCALTTLGAVLCWGSNAKGQLGVDPAGLTRDHSPRTIAGLAATALASGFGHLCAIVATGVVKCWGDNQHGQLGAGATADLFIPASATGLTGAVRLATGAFHTCAATPSAMSCWGRNDGGQLGSNGTTSLNVPTPTQATLAGVAQIAAGQAHTCALVGTAIQCWGRNDVSQLSGSSAGTTDAVTAAPAVLTLAPVTVSLAGTPSKLAVGLNHSCAQSADNKTWCWGATSLNRLGPNAPATAGAATPVEVP
jgi:alpha-tubulin suppressor-like RCC1 family protein